MRRAAERSASWIILVHNQPSGGLGALGADVDMTKQNFKAGPILRISVHDHLVVGKDAVARFKARGLI